MASFETELVLMDISDTVWRLHDPLVYLSDLIGKVVAPAGFYTDLASVPRVPFVFEAWGDKCHYESIIHDLLYCKDSFPTVSLEVANAVFLEAMIARGKPWYISRPMYWGVCLGGSAYYHKRCVGDRL